MKGLKKLRRLFALLMAMIMVMGTCITTQAANTNDASIIISNVALGETYEAWKLFDLSYDESEDSYYYKVSVFWEDFFAEGGDGAGFLVINNYTGQIEWNSEKDVEELAELAITYAKENNIESNCEATVDEEIMETGYVEFRKLSYGYYLVSSTVGSICSLTTANSVVTIVDKNGNPVVEKMVEENSTGLYVDTNTAGIGDDVNFKTTIKYASYRSALVLHDIMSNGLTLDSSSIEIFLNEIEKIDSKDYTIITDTEDGCTFEIEFTDDFTETLRGSDTIDVTYAAKVNNEAEIRGEGNDNTSYVTYGENGEGESETSKTTTVVYEINVYKTAGETGNTLEGAKFILYKSISDEKYYAVLDGNKISGWTKESDKATELTTNQGGITQFIGLDAGTYYLKETEAPEGFNALSEPLEVLIEESGYVRCDGVSCEGYAKYEGVRYERAVGVVNYHGMEMPSTGGIGTTIFYVIGSIMALGAAVILITRRRMHES